VNRPLTGLFALLLLAAWLSLFVWHLGWEGEEALQGACLRVGIVLGAIWLAQPQLERIPGWLFQSIGITALVIAARPRLALLALPVLLAYAVLRPRKKTGRNKPRRSSSAESTGKRTTSQQRTGSEK